LIWLSTGSFKNEGLISKLLRSFTSFEWLVSKFKTADSVVESRREKSNRYDFKGTSGYQINKTQSCTWI
jgi:hypothetical protein